MAFTGSPILLSDRSLTNPDLDATQFEGNMVTAWSGLYTHSAGAGVGEVDLIKLPPGTVRIYSLLSRIESTAMVATADLHIGTRAFTNEDGTAVAEDDNRFADNLDAGSAIDVAWPLPTGIGITELNSQEGITIYAMIDTANIEDTDTISVTCVYSRV